jgi:DNA mismatch repair protein MutS
MEVLEQEGKIIFLRKLKEGATEESYGLFVAQLAGIPERVLSRAAQIMDQLRRQESELKAQLVGTGAASGEPPSIPEESPILKELAHLDLDRMTPLEALARLYTWKDSLHAVSHKAKKQKPVGPSLFEE